MDEGEPEIGNADVSDIVFADVESELRHQGGEPILTSHGRPSIAEPVVSDEMPSMGGQSGSSSQFSALKFYGYSHGEPSIAEPVVRQVPENVQRAGHGMPSIAGTLWGGEVACHGRLSIAELSEGGNANGEINAEATDVDLVGKWEDTYGEEEGGGARPFLLQNQYQPHRVNREQQRDDGEEESHQEWATKKDDDDSVQTEGLEGVVRARNELYFDTLKK